MKAFLSYLHLEQWLMNDGWSEGTVYINFDKRELLLFGGEDIEGCNTLKRVYMAWLRISLKGWKVTWAKNELYDIANAIKYPLNDVISLEVEKSFKIDRKYLEWLLQFKWGDIITIKKNNKLTHRRIDIEIADFFRQGTEILPMLEGLLKDDLEKEWVESSDSGYIFIDEDNRKIYYDEEHERDYRFHDLYIQKWPGWKIIEHNQGIYKHCQLCCFDWRNYIMDEAEVIRQLSETMLSTHFYDPWTFQKPLPEGKEKPHYFNNDLPEPDQNKKKEYLNRVIDIWQSEENHFEKAMTSEIW
jgi:hypothetical protein